MRTFIVQTGKFDEQGIETMRAFDTLPEAAAFAKSIGVTRVSEMEISQKCCCPHPDARACLQARHPEIRRRCDVDTATYDAFIDEVCECGCHQEQDDA